MALPANIFRTGVLRTNARSVVRPAPSMFSFLGLRSQPWWSADEFPWASELQEKTDVIREEYLRMEETFPSDYNEESSLHSGEWEWRSMVKKGAFQDSFLSSAPETSAALAGLQSDLQVGMPFAYTFFSTQKPGTSISTHTSACNLRIRGHLPLIVPEGDCGLCVGNETISYSTGKLVLFDDAYPHSSWHHGEEGVDRVVLLFDIWPEVQQYSRGTPPAEQP